MTESFRKKTISVILTTNEQTERFALNLGKIIRRTPRTEITALFPFSQKTPSAYWLISESKSKCAGTEAIAWSASSGEQDRDPRPPLALPLLPPCSGSGNGIASYRRPGGTSPVPTPSAVFPQRGVKTRSALRRPGEVSSPQHRAGATSPLGTGTGAGGTAGPRHGRARSSPSRPRRRPRGRLHRGGEQQQRNYGRLIASVT